MPRYIVTLDVGGDRCTIHDVQAANAIEAVLLSRRDTGLDDDAELISAVEVGA